MKLTPARLAYEEGKLTKPDGPWFLAGKSNFHGDKAWIIFASPEVVISESDVSQPDGSIAWSDCFGPGRESDSLGWLFFEWRL